MTELIICEKTLEEIIKETITPKRRLLKTVVELELTAPP